MPTVLVVDDDSMMRRLVGEVLERAEYTVVLAEDGLVAYHLIRRLDGHLDLLLTDIQMPRMSGPELIRRVRAEYPNLKILCISAYIDPLAPNVEGFLLKPFSAANLVELVENILRSSFEKPRVEKPRSLRLNTDELHVRLVAAEKKFEAAEEEYRRGKLVKQAAPRPQGSGTLKK